jgi:hypothetical protein
VVHLEQTAGYFQSAIVETATDESVAIDAYNLVAKVKPSNL